MPNDTSTQASQDDSNWGEWLLVGVVVVSFVVIPALVLWRPPELPFMMAYLILPLIPAVLLGATAVWVALKREPRETANS